MATVTNYPIDLPILVIEAQIFVAVKKFPFLPNKLIPNVEEGASIITFSLFKAPIIPFLNVFSSFYWALSTNIMNIEVHRC